MNETIDQIKNYTFCFQCPGGRENLNSTDEEKVLFCNLCNKNVYFVETQTELDNLSKQGSCVAFIQKDSELAKATNQKISDDKGVCRGCGTKFHPDNNFCLNCGEVNPNSVSKFDLPMKPGVPPGVVMGQILPTVHCGQCSCELPFENRSESLCQDCKSKTKPKTHNRWWKFWN